MKNLFIARLGLVAFSFVGLAGAQDVAALAQPVQSGVVVKPQHIDKNVEAKVQVEFDEAHRQVSAFYSNESQARLKVYAVSRFDPEIAKPREYFIAELSGSAIIEPLKLNADDANSISAVVAILTRFQEEADKSSKLKEGMGRRKVALEAELSREETHLVELQNAVVPDAANVAASKSKIASLKDNLTLVIEVAAMSKITGVMGRAKIHLDRPMYEFVASFEPVKKLYTLSAGYSFQVAARDAVFYIDLLQRTQEFKAQLLEDELRNKKLQQEIKVIFDDK